jgi:hypothetical protein
MATTLSAQESMGTIDRFIQEVGAAEKRAEALSEPGSIGGETSHPVKNVDDRLEKVKEGERFKENTTDVNEDQGAPGIQKAPEAKAAGDKAFDLSRFAKPTGRVKRAGEGGAAQTPGSAADDHLQIGTKVEPTGEDPSVETGSAKAGKEDPGSSHPARTDNTSLDGHKYAEDQLDKMPLEELAKLASDVNNDFCAAISIQEPSSQSFRVKQAGDAQIDPALAHQAGWEMAGLMTGNFDKRAADALVSAKLQGIIKTAADDADCVATFLDSYLQGQADVRAMQKRAGAEGGPPPDPSMPPPPPQGGMPPGGDPMGGGGGGDPMGGGAPMMGPEAGGMGGGQAPDAMAAALGGGGGGAPGGAPGGMGGGGGGDVDPQVLELAKVLEQLGVTPEQLEQAMAQEEGGGGGGLAAGGPGGGPGADPSAGGGGPEGGAEPAKSAADKHASVKRGNTRDGVREYIQEVIQRSRRR